MNYVFSIGLVIIIIITTFLLFIFLPRPKCFFDVAQISHQLNFTDDELECICGELQETCGTQLLFSDCEPTQLAYQYAATYEVLRRVPYVKQVFIQQVPKKLTNRIKRKGNAPYSNETLRCVLPLRIAGSQKSGIWVDGETKFFQEGEWLCYDDSRDSTVFNEHGRLPTYLLVVDVQRPAFIPRGIALSNGSALF